MSGFFSPLTAASAVALGVLGARRRSHQPDGAGPTIGEQFASAGSAASAQIVKIAGGAGRFGSELLASAAEASGVATAITVRGATKLAGSLGSATVGVAGGAITKSGGLVVDGFAAIADVLRKPLEGRH